MPFHPLRLPASINNRTWAVLSAQFIQIDPISSFGFKWKLFFMKQQKPNLFLILVGKTIKHFSLFANTQKLLSEVEKFLLSVMDFNTASRFKLKKGFPGFVWEAWNKPKIIKQRKWNICGINFLSPALFANPFLVVNWVFVSWITYVLNKVLLSVLWQFFFSIL